MPPRRCAGRWAACGAGRDDSGSYENDALCHRDYRRRHGGFFVRASGSAKRLRAVLGYDGKADGKAL